MTNRCLAVFLLVFATCQHSEDRYAKRQVGPSQLIGTWRATPLSLKCIGKLPNEGHLTRNENEIVLRSDGSCIAKGYLNPIEDPPPRLGSTNRYESFDANCKWTIRPGKHQSLEIVDGAGHGADFYFDDSEATITLWQYVTDPDAWQYVEFQRD